MEALEEEGGIADPRALQERPELFPHLDLVWQAFFDASNARQIGMGGVGGIPPSEIEAEIRRFRIIDWDSQEEFHFYLRSMDHYYLEYQDKKRPKSP